MRNLKRVSRRELIRACVAVPYRPDALEHPCRDPGGLLIEAPVAPRCDTCIEHYRRRDSRTISL
jgi:hypothetical protein